MTANPQPRRRPSAPAAERRRLEERIQELQWTLEAVFANGVDGVVLQTDQGSDVYTLASADKPYRIILEEMGEGAITVSARGVVLFANRRFCDLVSRSRGEVLGQDLQSLVGEPSRDHVARLLTLRPAEVSHAELVLGGEHNPTVQVAATGLDQDGVTVTCMIFTDVSEIRNAAQQLKEAADRFSAVFDDAPQGMVLVDPAGTVLRANSVAGRLLRPAGDVLVGDDVAGLIHERDRDELAAELADLFQRRRSVIQRELRVVGGTELSGWIVLTGSLIESADGDHAVLHLEDVSSRRLYESRLQVLADRDALTGLFNRRRFHEELDRWLAAVARHGAAGALLLLDLDNFKYVNDTFGHLAGDQLLQRVGAGLTARARSNDVVGRLGGDEFAVILFGVDAEQAHAVGAAYTAVVRDAEVRQDAARLRATASAGIVVVQPGERRSAADLLADADVAMYEAKERGRDLVVSYDSTSPRVHQWRERFQALDMVRVALDEDRFVLFGQPILDLNTRQVTGVEVLLRLSQGQQLLLPADFLELAERHGLGPAVDRWVVQHSFDAISRLDPRQELRWEINLSTESLLDETVLDSIEAGPRVADLRTENVVFEITETAAISNMAQAEQFVRNVTELGFRFALDDFGAGYGSFYYLKHLPFDFLKIDGEFVRELAAEPQNVPIVSAVVSAAHALSKQTIAEYVQDQDTADLLHGLGVDHAQGRHVGQPQPLGHVVAQSLTQPYR